MTVQELLDDIRKRPGTGDVIPIVNPATERPNTHAGIDKVLKRMRAV